MRPLHDCDDVRAWIREAGRELGLSQRDLARAIGISPSHLSNFLAGRRALSETDIDALAELLALSPDERALLHDLLADDPAADDPWHAELRMRVAARRRQLRGEPAQESAMEQDYSGPAAMVLRELVSTAGFVEHPAALARRLIPEGEEARVRADLSLLLARGLLRRGEDGALAPGQGLGVELDIGRQRMAAWCAEVSAWGVSALERLDRGGRQSELLIQGVPASLHPLVSRELNGLLCWIRERCDQHIASGEPGEKVQLVLLRRWPLTIGLELAPGSGTLETPTPAPPPDYREGLRAWVAERPGLRTLGFIQRQLTRHLRPGEVVARPTIHAILKGRRHVPLEHIDAWRALMKLSDGADALFRAQVELAHARSDERRQERAREAAALGRFVGARWIPVEQSAEPRWWVQSVLLDLAMHPAGRAEPTWIAGVMCPPISASEAAQARDSLINLGALEITPEGGLKRLGTTSQRSGGRFERRSVAQLTTDLHGHAAAVRDDPRYASDHQATLLVQAVPASVVPEIEREIQRVLAWIQGACDQAVSMGEPPERIWAINVMRFPGSL